MFDEKYIPALILIGLESIKRDIKPINKKSEVWEHSWFCSDRHGNKNESMTTVKVKILPLYSPAIQSWGVTQL